ncbi:glycosyltransferase [Flavobacterium cellulosilyticum]|uniref:Glycosyltransferase family 1 protein n=1 Tax=Flavobacterium cellulosilyticum TaxID=2541731 RepID=A0A4R5CD25_9FLAO|nr:glycosyltransferase [Flavobacterium cellulosilyticum]TDD96190.1 glycosyltransferase family 1 protein [Flavobacterium cellulosilyticum]
MKKQIIVISGVNMVEGGIFTILDNCLQKIAIYAPNKNLKIIALVNDKSKFNYPNIDFIEFPKSKKSWLLRLYYEYFYFKKLSKEIKPDIWFSLHDTSPNVIAGKRFVYCHHPTVFYKPTFKDWKFNSKIGVFSILYKYLYQINLTKNEAVFVQQNWIKKEFEALYQIQNAIVSKPEYVETITDKKTVLDQNKIHFLYPSYPKAYKNFELILDAIPLLDKTVRDKTIFHFTTIKNNPSKFATYLCNKYANLSEVNFWGNIERNELLELYNSIDCILFPSKLETWGLPLSEAKAFKKPILAANLPYAKETVGDYEKVSFFDVDSPKELAELITKFVNQTIAYQGNKSGIGTNQINSWFELFDFILKEK